MCQSSKPPGHLVSIHSEEENNFVRKLAGDNNYKGAAWIGLTRNGTESDDWKWTDGSKVDFEKWYWYQPSGCCGRFDPLRCASIYLDSQWTAKHPKPYWQSSGCNLVMHIFVCKRPSKKEDRRPDCNCDRSTEKETKHFVMEKL
ncbi:lectin C-type domain protein [Ancylostoma ceylanicum]|uniref:Lectin C-type domain protein n=1 Tax=Ancylostoma ceylanicum TaxID=53326 RepID=A0A0D6MDJ5_9BILA|nr:lectin C-type domain protein [Ancylostoma ceylanicum]